MSNARILVGIYLDKALVKLLDENRNRTNPGMSRADYLEHIILMHQMVLNKKDEDIS